MENNNSPTQAAEHNQKIDPRNFDDILAVVASIKEQVGEETAHADIGIICGSGLGPIGDTVQEPTVLPYSKIPGFPTTHVVGHKGNMIFGKLGGKKSCLSAREIPSIRAQHGFGSVHSTCSCHAPTGN